MKLRTSNWKFKFLNSCVFIYIKLQLAAGASQKIGCTKIVEV